ncbi:MAG: hypothetical protein AAFO06_00240 [Cyanobacteria bacterium J06597_16]
MPISDASGQKTYRTYRTVSGNKQSAGKTAGQALDTLVAELGETNFSALLVIQDFQPDPFFNQQQQERPLGKAFSSRC